MAKLEVLTLSSLTGLVNARGAYLLGYSWLFGMSLWITFFGGVIAYKTLPRQQFGNLQHRTFPIYFVISIALSGALLTLWTLGHPAVLANLTKPYLADVAQAYALGSILVAQAGNYFVVGPLTSRTMFERHKLEKKEGKNYNDDGVSADMKAVNKRFAQLHGLSSLANLSAVIALIFHGLWIGNTSLGKI